MTGLFAFSCDSESIFEKNITSEKVTIPETLKGITEIETFLNQTTSQINQLAIETQQLITEYNNLSDSKNKKTGLMADVKKVTIRGRINAAFENLSEIYHEIDLQTSEMANLLNNEQKETLKVTTKQLKNKIDELMIYCKSYENEGNSGKIIFF
jgi:hypothetical protein